MVESCLLICATPFNFVLESEIICFLLSIVNEDCLSFLSANSSFVEKQEKHVSVLPACG